MAADALPSIVRTATTHVVRESGSEAMWWMEMMATLSQCILADDGMFMKLCRANPEGVLDLMDALIKRHGDRYVSRMIIV